MVQLGSWLSRLLSFRSCCGAFIVAPLCVHQNGCSKTLLSIKATVLLAGVAPLHRINALKFRDGSDTRVVRSRLRSTWNDGTYSPSLLQPLSLRKYP